MATTPISVVLADRNPLILGALSEYFDQDRRFSLVATTQSTEGVLEVCSRATVDVGVADWTLPAFGADKMIDILRNGERAPRIVVYSHSDGADIARKAMSAGAAAFCSRSESPERLLDVVAEVAAGRMVFPFLDIRDLRQDPLDSLTERERSLLSLLATGLSNKELADQLAISVNTVKFHLRNLYDKLSVRSRAQAIALYYSVGSEDRDR